MADDSEQTSLTQQLSLKVMRSFKQLRDEGHLIDFTIIAEDKKFKVHKIILAASSAYFRALFLHPDSKEMKESEVRLEDISCNAIESILNYCYTLELHLDPDNVREIILAANRLQVTVIQRMAVEFLSNSMESSNCLGIYSLAKHLGIIDLKDSSLQFCLDNFREVIQNEEFLEIDDSCLFDLVSNDQLDVDDEELLFEAVINWAQVDIDNRKQSLRKLMSNIRFATMDASKLVFLDKIYQDKDLSIYFQEYVDQAKDFLLLTHYSNAKICQCQEKISASIASGPELMTKLGMAEHSTRWRNSLRRQQRIFAVGGWTNDRPSEKVEKYNPYTDTWQEVSSMNRPRCGIGVAIIGESLYAIGGHDGNKYLNSVERYDIENDRWHEDVANMTVERTSFNVISLGNQIFAIGGQISGPKACDVVEKFDVKTNTWTRCAPLLRKRLGASVAVLDGYIYAVGGCDGITEYDVTMNSVERYDPIKDQWTLVASMKSPRKHFGCETCAGKLYAVGGENNTELDTGECYDPASDTWTDIKPMSQRRSGNGLVHLDGLLYVVGGREERLKLKSVEAYDIANNTWTQKQPMCYERVGAGVVVYSRLQLRAIDRQ